MVKYRISKQSNPLHLHQRFLEMVKKRQRWNIGYIKKKDKKNISQPVSQSSLGDPYLLQKLKKDYTFLKPTLTFFSFSYNFPSLMRSFEVWREMQTDFVFLIFNQKSLTRLVMVMMLMVVVMMVVKFKPIVFLIFKRTSQK